MGKSQSKLTPEELEDLQMNTDFNQDEINSWYNEFMQDYPNGRLDREQFSRRLEQFFPSGDPSRFAQYFFDICDLDQDGAINFKEFICPLSLISRGDPDQKLKWVFQVYDIDGDGVISYAEMIAVVQSVYDLLGQMVELAEDEDTPEKRVDKIFAIMDRDRDHKLTFEEFVNGSKQDPAIAKALYLYDGFV